VQCSQRVKRSRRRKRNGRAVLKIEVNVGGLADFLVDAGYLQQWNDSDRRAIERALAQAIEVWARA
jgi:hypothetical protein